MKMLKAIVRPERENEVVKALEAAGIVAMTRMDVLGRGQQGGVQVGATLYDEIPKVQFLVAVEDSLVEAALKAIQEGARTGSFGDGIVFVSAVEAAYTIRTGAPASGAASWAGGLQGPDTGSRGDGGGKGDGS